MFPTQFVQAQYEFKEAGLRFGGGVLVSQGHELLPKKNLSIGEGGNLHIFYSDYTCGKAYGYHLEGGTNLLYLKGNSPEFEARYIAPQFDLGAYFKIRPSKNHKPQEVAWMIGPKLSALQYEDYMGNYKGGESKTSNNAQEGTRNAFGIKLEPGVHTSFQFRLKRDREYSYFITTGLEYYRRQSKVLAVSKGQTFYFFINLGLNFWTNR